MATTWAPRRVTSANEETLPQLGRGPQAKRKPWRRVCRSEASGPGARDETGAKVRRAGENPGPERDRTGGDGSGSDSLLSHGDLRPLLATECDQNRRPRLTRLGGACPRSPPGPSSLGGRAQMRQVRPTSA